MCGRYALHAAPDVIAARFAVGEMLFEPAPRYNIAPTQRVAVVTADAARGVRFLEGHNWGLIPFWADDPRVGQRLINARAETLAERPAFKYALARRRCIIPASGFYEWKRFGEQHLPLYVRPHADTMFALAGLWEEWHAPDGKAMRTCVIVTTEANAVIGPLHRRMPVILRPEDEAAWLDTARRDVPALLHLLQPCPAAEMDVFAVSQRVNSASCDDALCIAPDAATAQTLRLSEQPVGKSRRGRAPRRRCVRRDYVAPGGQVFFHTRSFTRDDFTRWHPVVDLEAGLVFCDCPDFRFRHARFEPGLGTPQFWCKHVARAVNNCRRHGEIARPA